MTLDGRDITFIERLTPQVVTCTKEADVVLHVTPGARIQLVAAAGAELILEAPLGSPLVLGALGKSSRTPGEPS